MEIKTEDYCIGYKYDRETATVSCKGSLRLGGVEEYQPIIALLNDVAEIAGNDTSQIILNLRELEFLNSSGISMLSKFVIKVRQKKTVDMIVQGSKGIPWQGKSLKNLQRLMPSLTLELT